MRELKKEAKTILRERFGLILLGFLMVYLIPIIIPTLISVGVMYSGHYYLSTIILFITALCINSIAMLGKCYFSLNVVKRSENTSLLNLLFGFKKFYKPIALTVIIWIIFMLSLFIVGIPWVIIFGRSGDIILDLIAGVIMAAIFIYEMAMISQSYFILAEDNTKGIIQCLKESKELMKDNKLRYVGLILSFIGWFLLFTVVMIIVMVIVAFINEGLLPLSNIIIYVLVALIYPYIELTFALFHLKIKEEKNDKFDNVDKVGYIVDPQ